MIALVVATLRYRIRIQTGAIEGLIEIPVTIIKLTEYVLGIYVVPSPLLHIDCCPTGLACVQFVAVV
jgi:hypothetical protein